MNPRLRTPFLAALAVLAAAAAAPAADPTLELVQTIASKGKAGELDHLALDAKGQRLFLSNKANDTLDVLDLKAGQLLKQITGQNAVQGVAYAPELNRIYAALGTGGLCNVFNGESYKIVKTLNFKDTADNVRLRRRPRPGLRRPRREVAGGGGRQDQRRQGGRPIAGRRRGVRPGSGAAAPLHRLPRRRRGGRHRHGQEQGSTAHYPVKMGAEFPAIALDEAAAPGCTSAAARGRWSW